MTEKVFVASGDWFPITDEQKDGRLVLAGSIHHGTRAVVGWTKDPAGIDFPNLPFAWTDVGGKNCGAAIRFSPPFFTHWQPLPEPPK